MLKNSGFRRSYVTERVNDVQNYQIPKLFKDFGIQNLNILVMGPK